MQTYLGCSSPQLWSTLGCLCPCQGRLRVLQGCCAHPREQSPASAAGESQALDAVCHPGAADDPVSLHIFPVIAGSLGGLVLHSVTEAGISPQEALSLCTRAGAWVCQGTRSPAVLKGVPKVPACLLSQLTTVCRTEIEFGV